MMPEIGNALLCLALGVALLLSVYPLWGVARGDVRMMASARPFAWVLFICVMGAFLILVNAFGLMTLPSPTSPATPIPSFRSGIGWQQPGARMKALCCCGYC